MGDADSFYALFPDTPSVKATLEFVKKHLDPPTYGHVVRSAAFSCTINNNLSKDPSFSTHLRPVDIEVVVVASLMHDMAWNPDVEACKQFVSKHKRFEIDGADAGREFLQTLPKDHGWDTRRLQQVWDCIAYHSSISLACWGQPEVALCNAGILFDIVGPQAPFPGIPEGGGVSGEFYGKAYAVFPGHSIGRYVKQAFCGLCRDKPDTAYDNLVGTVGDRYQDGFTLEGHKFVDMLEMRIQMDDKMEGK